MKQGLDGSETMKIPHELERAVRGDGLLELLQMVQAEPLRAEYMPEQFGNYLIEFSGSKGALMIVRDRGLVEVHAKQEGQLSSSLLIGPTAPPDQELWNAICLGLVKLEVE